MTSEVSVLVLCGGQGRRIRDIHPDTPKPLIPVLGRPFLDWITAWIVHAGITKINYSTGFLAEQIEAWKDNGHFPGTERDCFSEAQPLGTGGALFNFIERGHPNDWIMVLNGDGLISFDLRDLFTHTHKDVDGLVLGVRVSDASRYGSLNVAEDGRLIKFDEKVPGAGLINAGVYLFQRSTLEAFQSSGASSIETDLITRMLSEDCQLQVVDAGAAPFIDIGTPKSLADADRFIQDHFEATLISHLD